jgi:8-oxo-dGTP diphosphatase
MPEKKPFRYKHPHPAVTADLAIFTLRENQLHVLLIERGREPFKGAWALPGGFVRIQEDLQAAAARELLEETGVAGAYLEQVGAFGHPDRDPRERVISVAFFAIISSDRLHLQSGGDAAAARWWPANKIPKIAFDHLDIVEQALHRLREKLRRSTIALRFLPAEFTLTELQQVHEAILGQELDKRNFRKWLTSVPYVRPTGRMRRGGQHRPAELFRKLPLLVERTGPGNEPRDDLQHSDADALAAAYRGGYQAAKGDLASTPSAKRVTIKRARRA